MEEEESKNILLVLDLDETLIYATKEKLSRVSDFEVFDYQVYKRPYLREFIAEAKLHFKLAVWSSASDDYVKEVTSRIFEEEIELEFVWGRSRCTYRRNFLQEERRYYSYDPTNHYYYVKPLRKLKRKGYKLNQILIVDDTPHKSQDNYGNVIYPREYRGEQNDNELKLLSKYLKSLKDELNVRKIEKRGWKSKIK